MHEFGVFALPIILPVFAVFFCPFLSERDISDKDIKPNIKHLTLCIGQWYGYSPVEVSGHRTRFQTVIKPRLHLPVDIGFPILLMSLDNPLIKEIFILIKWQIPVLSRFKDRNITAKHRFRVDEL